MSHSEAARDLHARAVIVDLHCDLLLTTAFLGWDWRRRHAPNPFPGAPFMGHTDIPRLQGGNVGCVALGVVTNPLRRASAPKEVERDLDRMHAAVAASPGDIVVVGSPAEVRAARAAGRIAVFAGLEGAHGLSGSVDDLGRLRARGLGYVGLAHFSRNAACRPMVGYGSSATEPLTDHGRELVDALGRHRIVVDVAHVGRAAVLEVCRRARGPVICSHTACTAVHPSPRCIDDEQIRAIADTGGVVGVTFVRAFLGPGGARAVAAHLDHVRRLVGAHHAGFGSDWEGWATYPDDLDSAEKLPALTHALLEMGWTEEEVLGALGENFLRAWREVLGEGGG